MDTKDKIKRIVEELVQGGHLGTATTHDIEQALTNFNEQHTKEKQELYEALEMMWEQYCPEPSTHQFMTAGENCEEVLEKYSYLKSTPY